MSRLRLQLLRVLAIVLLAAAVGRAEFPTSRPFEGVGYGQAVRIDPPMRLYWVTVDLGQAGLSVAVSPGGADPDGEGPYQTTLARPSAVARREGFDVAVNGDFFSVKPEASGYFSGQWAMVTGPAMTDGRRWSAGRRDVPCLAIGDGRASVAPAEKLPADARHVIAGNVMLVRDGRKVPQRNQAVHPRTAAGVSKDGKRLVLLVVDGRRPLTSVGMDYAQLADEMIRLGCHDALNLDGGGSSVLVMYDPEARTHRVLNVPSDGLERPVANVLGVRVNKGR